MRIKISIGQKKKTDTKHSENEMKTPTVSVQDVISNNPSLASLSSARIAYLLKKKRIRSVNGQFIRVDLPYRERGNGNDIKHTGSGGPGSKER